MRPTLMDDPTHDSPDHLADVPLLPERFEDLLRAERRFWRAVRGAGAVSEEDLGRMLRSLDR